MKPYCEVIIKDVLPAVRAMVAKNLIDFGLSQKQIALKMGTTQPAVSQYKRELRGSKNKIFKEYPELLKRVSQLAKRIAQDMVSGEKTIPEFCSICQFLKSENILCKLHKDLYPSLENCSVCFEK